MRQCHTLYIIIYKTVHWHSQTALNLIDWWLINWYIDWLKQYWLLCFCILCIMLFLNVAFKLIIDLLNIDWLVGDVCAVALTHCTIYYWWVFTYCSCIVDCESARGSLELKSPRPVTLNNYNIKHNNVYHLDKYLLGILGK